MEVKIQKTKFLETFNHIPIIICNRTNTYQKFKIESVDIIPKNDIPIKLNGNTIDVVGKKSKKVFYLRNDFKTLKDATIQINYIGNVVAVIGM